MDLINKLIIRLVNPVIGLVFAAGVAFFLWGIIEFIFNADNEEKRTEGKRHIIWGLVGLFIMSAVAGIIEIIQRFVRF